ncbi:hypothetical protein BELL_0348g00010 [Botrytis elliptica]|uniref:Uncharacterized protein n=1 Tax=Botrytis elliptica TaxID=278938 RepID=A0A4Z1JJC3_9HELO|nr:hypothetical protein BELL_0348g00010 [Botrytis elliptica]
MRQMLTIPPKIRNGHHQNSPCEKLPSRSTRPGETVTKKMVAWEALQEAVRVQARAVAAYQNTVSNFKLVWEEVRSEGAIVKPATA